jgi:signal transduction histidine kinase
MDRERDTIAETRAETDARLDAERSITDAATDRVAAAALRALDALIARDRILADERLSTFRASADRTLARERSESVARESSVAVERYVADEGKRAEREITDALLEDERQRSDAGVQADRKERKEGRLQIEGLRNLTDDGISNERAGTDDALDEATGALADARSEQAHRREVLGMVTHDLRDPLCVIALNAQSIMNLSTEASVREAAQDVTRAAARMGRLVSDLLEVARIESGTLRLIRREHDARALVTELLHLYGPLFAERGMILTGEEAGAPVIATFDHDRIAQVLSNLLGNAMKFARPRGTVGIRVASRPEEIELAVQDDGPGVRPEALPHVFERFWQSDGNERRGLGLGLYICEKIVEAHGGRIWVESTYGSGATFRFTLPVG